MASVIAGIFVSIISMYFLVLWWNEFLYFIKGVFPVSFFLAGIIAIIMGINGMLTRNTEKLKVKSKKIDEKQ